MKTLFKIVKYIALAYFAMLMVMLGMVLMTNLMLAGLN